MDYEDYEDYKDEEEFELDRDELVEALKKAFGIKPNEDKPEGIVTIFGIGQWNRNCLIRASYESNREIIIYDITDNKIPSAFIYNPLRKEKVRDNGHPFIYEDEFMAVIFGHDLSRFWKIARNYDYNSAEHHPEKPRFLEND